MYDYKNLSDLVGKTMTTVEQVGRNGNDAIRFVTDAGEEYHLTHCQDCCESVSIESIAGDLQDLVGSPILLAEEATNSDRGALDTYDESYTWTFYKFATIKGYVDIRWYGTSNGYYSESVDFIQAAAGQ